MLMQYDDRSMNVGVSMDVNENEAALNEMEGMKQVEITGKC